jgi:hypothetical protein
MRYLIYPLVGLILAISTSLNAGTIQKWVDDKGNVHYGDAPPVEVKSENVRVQSAPTNPGKALPRLNQPDAEEDAAGGDDQEVSEEQASAVCERARNDLEIINNSDRIQIQQPDGSSRYLDPDEIETRRSKSQADVSRFCK